MVTAERSAVDYEIPEHRTLTPGVEGWARTARPGDPDKYFMVSADCHVHEPVDLWERRVVRLKCLFISSAGAVGSSLRVGRPLVTMI